MPPHPQWIQETLAAVEKRLEAFKFLERVREQCPSASLLHAESVTRLWSASEDVDYLLCPLLETLQNSLLMQSSEIVTTQGATIRHANGLALPRASKENQTGLDPEPIAEVLVYECSWSLQWENTKKSITITLSLEPVNNTITAKVSAKSWPIPQEIIFPISESQLKLVLSEYLVKELTSDELKSLLQLQTDSLARQEYEMQQRVLQELKANELISE